MPYVLEFSYLLHSRPLPPRGPSERLRARSTLKLFSLSHPLRMCSQRYDGGHCLTSQAVDCRDLVCTSTGTSTRELALLASKIELKGVLQYLYNQDI